MDDVEAVASVFDITSVVLDDSYHCVVAATATGTAKITVYNTPATGLQLPFILYKTNTYLAPYSHHQLSLLLLAPSKMRTTATNSTNITATLLLYATIATANASNFLC